MATAGRMCLRKFHSSLRIGSYMQTCIPPPKYTFRKRYPFINDYQRVPYPSYTDVEESAEEFKYVERLMPQETVPAPPQHLSYPTPSGWTPPTNEISPEMSYTVSRTKNHMFPVYAEMRNGNRALTKIRFIDGDIWQLESDLRTHLKQMTNKDILTQVHEVARFIRIKGHYAHEVSDFLLQKGF